MEIMQHCNCRLTLAWFTSENSTKQLECCLILTRSSSLSLDPISCRLVSPLRCPVPTASLRRPSPTAPSSSFFQLSLLASPCTSGHCEISSPKPFVGFRAKTDKGIVCLQWDTQDNTFSVRTRTPLFVGYSGHRFSCDTQDTIFSGQVRTPLLVG